MSNTSNMLSNPEICRQLISSTTWSKNMVTAERLVPGLTLCQTWVGSLTWEGYANYRRIPAIRIIMTAEMGRVLLKEERVGHICHDAAVEQGLCSPGYCSHRACVNPKHLRLLTAKANAIVLIGQGPVQRAVKELTGDWVLC